MGACAHRFLHRLLNWPGVDNAVRMAGGWGIVERLAASATLHATDEIAAVAAPLSDVAAFRARLAAGLGDAAADKRAALLELGAIARTSGPTVSRAAQDAAKAAHLYPDCCAPEAEE